MQTEPSPMDSHSSGPLVSCVLPTFNRGDRLGDAVDSVLTQTHTDLELIIVDDASDPAQRPKPGDFDDARVRIVQRPTNGGVAAAQNTGLDESAGTYVAFVHSDDRWEPNKLAHQISMLDNHPSAGAVESATRRLTDAGEQVIGPRTDNASYDDMLSRRVRNLHICGFLFRRSAVEAAGGFDAELRSYEDFDLLVRLMRDHEILCTDEVVVTLDQRSGDRLAESPWMAKARSQLLDKYSPELLHRFGRLPDGWRDWSVQLAVAAVSEGEGAEARRLLARAGKGNPKERLKRAPLYLSGFSSRRTGGVVTKLYRRRW